MPHRPLIIGAFGLFYAATASAQPSRGLRISSEQETTSSGTGMFEQFFNLPSTRATVTTEMLRGRLRTEVVHGTMAGIPAGQYSLQDTLDFLIVDPTTRTFTRLSYRAERPATASVSVRMDSLTSTMDSAQVMDSVSGTMATRYVLRLSQQAVGSVNASALPAGMTIPDTRTTTVWTYEFWFAIGENDQPEINRPPSSRNSALAFRMGEMFARLPRKRPIRSVVASRTEGEAGTNERRTTMRTITIDSVTMDATRFALPADYTERALMPGTAVADSAWLARWRMPPG